MAEQDYTPTTGHVYEAYARDRNVPYDVTVHRDGTETGPHGEFCRWLAARDAKVARATAQRIAEEIRDAKQNVTRGTRPAPIGVMATYDDAARIAEQIGAEHE